MALLDVGLGVVVVLGLVGPGLCGVNRLLFELGLGLVVGLLVVVVGLLVVVVGLLVVVAGLLVVVVVLFVVVVVVSVVVLRGKISLVLVFREAHNPG